MAGSIREKGGTMKRVACATALGCLLLLASASPSPALIRTGCASDIRGSSGGCSFICYLTLIECASDGSGNITCDCIYGECYSFCQN